MCLPHYILQFFVQNFFLQMLLTMHQITWYAEKSMNQNYSNSLPFHLTEKNSAH